MNAALLVSVFLIASAGLIYELVASSLASYLIGDSVFQFSTVIGTYLFAMGVGSWLSRYLRRGLVAQFIGIELMVAVVGGFSSMALMLAFAAPALGLTILPIEVRTPDEFDDQLATMLRLGADALLTPAALISSRQSVEFEWLISARCPTTSRARCSSASARN